jgi:hypothetical protein
MTIIDGEQLIIQEKLPDKVVINEVGPQAALLLRELIDVNVAGEQIGNVLVLLGFDANNQGLYGFVDVATDAEVSSAIAAARTVFIQETQPTDEQTALIDQYIWYELRVDGTLKTVWHGRRV